MIATIAIIASMARVPADRPLVPGRDRFVVIAHRGAHETVPENTLEAYQLAASVGVDYAEMDLRTTKDGVLINMHDSTVDRTTNGKGKVSDLDWAQISKLKINETYRVPTFREVLATLRRGKVNLYLDFKEADPARAYAEIKAERMERNTLVYVYGLDEAKAWRKVAPNLPLMSEFPDTAKTGDEIYAFAKTADLDLFDGPFTRYTPEITSAARRAGVLCWPDIQNPGENPKQWQMAIDDGVTGLQTDHPTWLIAYLKSKGLRR
jgi:glycerophosphoryl diester phosphodiesterase